MTPDKTAEAQRLRSMVMAVMEGAARAEPTGLDGSTIDGTLMIQAFRFIIAAMIEAHPTLATAQGMQSAVHMQAKEIEILVGGFREEYQRTGCRVWDTINASSERLQ